LLRYFKNHSGNIPHFSVYFLSYLAGLFTLLFTYPFSITHAKVGILKIPNFSGSKKKPTVLGLMTCVKSFNDA